MPEISKYWEDINPGLNLVYGAALGSYLGINIQDDLEAPRAVLLFVLLLLLAFSVTNLELGAKRFHQHNIRYSFAYFATSLVSGSFAVGVTYALGFNPLVPSVILGAWFCNYVMECYVTSPGLRKDVKPNV